MMAELLEQNGFEALPGETVPDTPEDAEREE